MIDTGALGTESTRIMPREMEKGQTVLEQTPSHDLSVVTEVNNLAISMCERYKHTGSIEDLTRAIETTRKAIERVPDTQPSLAICLNNLGALLSMRYNAAKSMVDLTTAIEVAEESIKLTPDDDPSLAKRLSSLGHCLDLRYKRTLLIDDPRRSIRVTEESIKLTSDDDPGLVVRLTNLGTSLGASYIETARINDLGSAIEVFEKVVKMVPRSDNHLPKSLNYLCHWLRIRFQEIGSLKDLERAIEVIQEAIEVTSEDDHIALAEYLYRLGICLGYLSEQKDSMDDLEKAIRFSEQAIATLPENHSYLATLSSGLGKWLTCKYNRTGSVDIMARATEAFQKAVDSACNCDTEYVTYLKELGDTLAARYQQTGSVDDLTKAIETYEKAATSAPDRHPSLESIFRSLAGCFGIRYERTRSEDDCTRAMREAEKAVEATPHNHKTHATTLSNLGIHLWGQFTRTGVMDNLTKAIEVCQEAVNESGHSDLAWCLSNLGKVLMERYRQTGSMEDLKHAIEAAQRVVKVTPHGHTHRSLYLGNLGHMLGRLHALTSAEEDQDAQISAYLRAWQCTTSPPADRVLSAKRAAYIQASRQEWDKAYDLLLETILLLPKVSQRSLKQSDMQSMLLPTFGLAMDAATIALNARKNLLEVLSILELGRGVIASLPIDSRGDLSGLREMHPSLADRFDALRKELDSHPQDSFSMVQLSMVNRRHQAGREFDEVIQTIRAQDGFHDFLQPPLAKTIMTAAVSGPVVVIIVSAAGCVAILVEHRTARSLQLPGLILDDIEGYVGKIGSAKHNPWPLLEWLWTTVCKPCLDALGFREPVTNEQWPHVWWVPTGPLSQLPLHAAGVYTPGSKETVLDRVISSYASSIKALQHGRQRREVVIDESTQQNDAILIAMEQTQGQTSLPNARRETDEVKALCPLLQLNAKTPPRRKPDILKHLGNCKILHFAGHGECKRDPSQSCLLLDDWKADPLTVADLRQSWNQESPAFLAYLSACSTGSNQGDGLSDEAIHLVSAFQLAGFRHVVGTLWEVSDPHCVVVATVLYETLCDKGLTDEAVSFGLHRAVRKLRDDCFREGRKRDIVLVGEDEGETPRSSVNTFWIPYIHYGA